MAPRGRLDEPAPKRTRQERLQLLARQTALRGLALGYDAGQILEAVRRELARHGHTSGPSTPPTPLGEDEVPLLSARNRFRGTVTAVRAGEMLAEVTLEVVSTHVVAAITRTSLDKLGLERGSKASAFVKATDITMGEVPWV